MIPHAHMVLSIEPLVVGAEIDIDDALDLTAAALDAEDPVLERSRLVSRHYVHGRHRRWVAMFGASDDGGNNRPTVVSLTLHQFSDARQAEFSLADLREQLRAAAVSQLRSSRRELISTYTDDEGNPMACCSCVVGSMQITVAVGGPAGADVTTIADAVAGRQAALTEAHDRSHAHTADDHSRSQQ